MSKCVIEYDPEFSSKHEVFLASFANGQISNDEQKLNFHTYLSASNEDGLQRKRERKILVADTGRLQYVGYNFGPEASQSSGLCRFHVGLLNKRTKNIRVLNAQHYKMQPIIETYDEQQEETEKSFMEQVDLLTGAFGSKRKRKAMAARHRYSVKSDNMEKASQGAVDEGKELSIQLDVGDTAASENQPEAIPPQNKNAKRAQYVYNVNDIITEEENNALLESAQSLLNATAAEVKTWKTEERYSSYVLEHISFGAQKRRISQDTAKMLSYFTFLLHMLHLKAKDVKRKDPLPDVPEPFKNTILDKYAIVQKYENGKTQRNFPQRLKDKVVAALLVLALFIDDFHINLTNLQTSLKLPMNKLKTICYALGCHVKSTKNADKEMQYYGELKIPLFVKGTIPKGKKRK